MPVPVSSRANVRRLALLAGLAIPPSACSAPVKDTTAESEQAIIPCAPTTIHYGDLTIATATDSTAYRCVTEVRGNLTVTAAPETLHRDVDLSNLRSVSGDVSLAYAPVIEAPTVLRQVNLSKLWNIVGPPQPAAARAEALGVRREDTPGSGSGSLDVVIDFGTTVTADPAFRLQALSAIDGNVTVEIKGKHPLTNPTTGQQVRITSGLEALTTVHGDLRMTVTSSADGLGNAKIGSLLHRLQSVQGNVTFHPSSEDQWGAFLPLTSIGGDLDIAPTGDGSSGSFGSVSDLDFVRQVGGAIRMQNVGIVAHLNSTSRTFSLSDSPWLQWVNGGRGGPGPADRAERASQVFLARWACPRKRRNRAPRQPGAQPMRRERFHQASAGARLDR